MKRLLISPFDSGGNYGYTTTTHQLFENVNTAEKLEITTHANDDYVIDTDGVARPNKRSLILDLDSFELEDIQEMKAIGNG